MLSKCVLLVAIASLGAGMAMADTIQLKEKATITGKILAEKRDQVAVDVGYTILVVPRSQIVKVLKTDNSPAQSPTRELTPVPIETELPKLADSGRTNFYTVSVKPAAARTVRELASELGEAVVQVRTPSGLGSGFVINEEGYLMTNFHVIEGETQISVEVYHRADVGLERRTYKQVRIIAINKFGDLALLRIEEPNAPKFKWTTLGSSDALSVGESVFAIGSPLGLERTVTEGILSTKTRQIGGELYLQTTTQINPGNSGGPLFNLRGEVVGITNMKITFGEGLGFAIPMESVRYFLDHRDAFAYSSDNPSNPYRYLVPPSRTQKTAVPD